MANAHNNVLTAKTACSVNRSDPLCKNMGTTKNQFRMVLTLVNGAQQGGLRSVEEAIRVRKARDDRAQLARCSSLQEQLQTAALPLMAAPAGGTMKPGE